LARIITFPAAVTPDAPVVGAITSRTWGATGEVSQPERRDPLVAAERMWWRATGRLAYPAGATFSKVELALLVSDTEHQANMRAGISDAEAAGTIEVVDSVTADPVDAVPEHRLIVSSPERRGGRPRLPRDADGNVIR
jgi:hypothetical protein